MNIALHRRILLDVLQKIYTHAALAPMLGFKGGTSLYFLHQLNRFSVDLDFNLVDGEVSFPASDLHGVLESVLTLHDAQEKEHTWFWNGVYKPGQWNMKVEVSKRQYDDRYEYSGLFGLPIKVLTLEHQLSHKLCAITNRTVMVNRDIFDAHFLLKKHVSPDATIIRERTGLSVTEHLQALLDFIPANISHRGILDGLGELIHPETKQWVRDSLLKETLFLIRSRADEDSKK